MGKLRVRLSTVAAGRPVTAHLPLLAARDAGGARVGAATLTLRLDFASSAARLAAYFRPALPAEQYTHGLDAGPLQAALEAARRRMVLRWLEAAEPPLRPAVALAVLDTEREDFQRSRLSANLRRIKLATAALARGARFLRRVQSWESRALSLAACAVCLGAAFLPGVVLPALLAWAAAGCWRARPALAGVPPAMEEDADQAAEEAAQEEQELDAEVASFRVLTRRYLSLRRITLRLQNATDDVASGLERAVSLASWEDPVATAVVAATLAILAALAVLVGLRVLVAAALLHTIRPPRLRTPTPPPPAALFMRLPCTADRIV